VTTMPEQPGRRVELDVTGPVGTIRLPHGDRGNPLGLQTLRELVSAVEAVERAGCPVVVLRATGRFFCVGGDLREMRAAVDPEAHVRELADTLAAVVTGLTTMDAVVVSVVQGAAAGAGVALAAAADLVVAAESATFTLAYSRAGLSPDGGTSLLVSTLGLHRTLAWALLSPVVTAAEARDLGLVVRTFPDEALHDGVEQVLRQLTEASAPALATTKRLVRRAVRAGDDLEQLRLEAEAIGLAAASDDGQAGVAAFLDKTEPVFPSARRAAARPARGTPPP
jgi:2-(1,2-epoxy-1,2-dihydrophenyl)acetyl-CoA isomerase